jgi:hypothetical protein
MYPNRLFFGSKNTGRLINKILRPVINYLLLVILLFLILGTISAVGFSEHNRKLIVFIVNHFRLIFTLVGILYLFRTVVFIGFRNYTVELAIFASATLYILVGITLDLDRNIEWLNSSYFYSLIAIGLLIFELSRIDIKQVTWILNPAQLFMISFGSIIIMGALLLMLPNATVKPIILLMHSSPQPVLCALRA